MAAQIVSNRQDIIDRIVFDGQYAPMNRTTFNFMMYTMTADGGSWES